MLQDNAQWDKQQLARQASFLQSSLWAQFQAGLGSLPHFVSGKGWTCLLLERKTPLGRYLFAPYGPTIDNLADTKSALGELRTYAKEQGADWLRLEPMLSGTPGAQLRPHIAKAGGKSAPHNVEPSMTRILDLRPSAEELLASISQSTRSFIRKNQRENLLSFNTSTEPADIEIFTQMLGTISQRKGVYFFNDDYFKKEAELLMPAGMMHLELALQNNKPVASALFHDYGTLSSYTFAASLPEARTTSASALLLWQAMLNAKQRDMQKMDLYGIAPENASPSHPWHGFTDFKKKFGGEVVEYAGTWDIPVSQKYKAYRAAYRAKSLLRRR